MNLFNLHSKPNGLDHYDDRDYLPFEHWPLFGDKAVTIKQLKKRMPLQSGVKRNGLLRKYGKFEVHKKINV